MQAGRSVLLRMPATFAYRELACRAVEAIAKLCFGADTAPDGAQVSRFTHELVSAVGEAFNNIVIHAYNGEAEGMVEIEFYLARDHVVLEMRDRGESFDFDAVPDLDLNTPLENGMGVHIIRSLVDEAEYRAGSPNVLVLRKSVVLRSAETSA
jgi:anti-sigma regulatory factor (Ser/Thr protein kinase)